MKYHKLLLLVLTNFLYVSCKCEGTFKTISVLTNSSIHAISISPYRYGVIQSNSIFLEANSSKKIDLSSGRSKGAIWSSPFLLSDSLLVTFDNNKKVIHYGREGTNKSAIFLSSPRNLFSENSYQKKTAMEDKCYLETEFIYTFVEQDYLNIK